jgi:hypothetical protein
VDASSLWRAIRLVGGTKGHATSPMHATCIVEGAAIRNGTLLAPRGQGPKHSGATCTTCVCLNIFGRLATSLNTTAKLILVYGCRTTNLLVEWAGRTMTFLSFNSSPFTWWTCLEPDSITCLETRSIVGKISRISLLAIFKAHTYGPAILGN